MPIGGSANINGVLYQVLATLEWAAAFTLAQDRTGAAPLLTVEPARGGDLQISHAESRSVIQYKTRTNHRPWALREIVSDVLPDLYQATATRRPASYEFITNGRRGRTAEAEAFFASLRDREWADSLSVLDDTHPKPFFPTEPMTERAFFESIVKHVQRTGGRDQTIDAIRVNTWHLLSHFTIIDQVGQHAIEERIDNALGAMVDVREDLAGMRGALVETLLRWSAAGNRSFSASELFSAAGLRSRTPKKTLGEVRQNAYRRLREKVARQAGYDAAADVRSAPDFFDASLLLIAGESGVGKTWQLARVGLNAPGIVIWRQYTDSIENVLQAAADELWLELLEHDHPLQFTVVCRRIKEQWPGLEGPCVTLCIDDVQEHRSTQLLDELDLEGLGVRVALTTRATIGETARAALGDRANLINLEPFTNPQLRAYLRRRDRLWGAIPDDLRDTLRLPLLARLYCDLSPGPNWESRTEYAVFARYWDRIRATKTQPDHLYDQEKVRQLASTLLNDQAPYPWPADVLLAAGVDEETRTRLSSIGWLREEPDGAAQLWHPRLMNWAVAESIMTDWHHKKIVTGDVITTLRRITENDHQVGERRLGYVLMDVLWLALDQERAAEDAARVLQGVEAASVWRGYPSELYGELLPTLGERCIPLVLARMALDPRPQAALASTALLAVARKHPSLCSAAAASLLNNQDEESQAVALRILNKHPTASVLDQLRSLVASRARRAKDEEGYYLAYHEATSAFHACVTCDIDWIVNQLKRPGSGTDDQVTLLYALAASGRDGCERTTWAVVKPLVIDRSSSKERQALLACMDAFGDSSELDRVADWVMDDETWLGLFSMQFLARYDPRRLLALLMKKGRGPRTHPTMLPMDALLDRAPRETRRTLLRALPDTTEGNHALAMMWRGHEHAMDAATLDRLLSALQQGLEEIQDDGCSTNGGRFFHLLSVLANVTHPDLLRLFADQRGSRLEELLSAAASAWVGRSGHTHEPELEDAETVLLKVGGRGFARVVNAKLTSNAPLWRREGLRQVSILPDEQVRSRVRQRATCPNAPADGEERHEEFLATIGVAALDDRAALVEAIQARGLLCPLEVVSLRAGRPPFTDDELRPALDVVRNRQGDSLPGAVMSIGLSGRTDLVRIAEEFVTDPATDTDTLKAALLSLAYLRSSSNEVLERVVSLLDDETVAFTARQALTAHRDDALPDRLEEWLGKRAHRGLTREEQQLALWAKQRSSNPRSTARLLWEGIRNQRPGWGIIPGCWEEIADANDAAALDRVYDVAYTSRAPMVGVADRAAAIRGLAQHRRGDAFEAAEVLLNQDEKALPHVGRLMLELDERRCVHFLLTWLPHVRDVGTLWHGCRILRRASERVALLEGIAELLQDASARARETGALIAGWQREPEFDQTLQELARHDPHDAVRRAAHLGIKRRCKERQASTLRDRLDRAPLESQWSLAEAFSRCADPWLVWRPEDPVWIGNTLARIEPGIAEFLRDRLGQARKRVEKDAKDATWRRRET